nr:hypothetical protein [Bacillus mycoides]
MENKEPKQEYDLARYTHTTSILIKLAVAVIIATIPRSKVPLKISSS